MAVTIDDVKHVARLARLGMTDERAGQLVSELNRILEHMAVLEKVDVEGVMGAEGVGAAGMPLRADAGPPIPLAHALDSFAPASRDGFLLVPRLASHEDAVEETE
ncbi:MAG TPA: Asp-tRNA(Asn)/Glu-tRNA(Gln) amidotransferase subunit GatC [Gemmatimonadaceae bacterium]|nr:Asp-tRNA(Asn)/Glu-tRNA(Gln) amidotransferase subunit GatC [Gemmatimonadaceae bacterium]